MNRSIVTGLAIAVFSFCTACSNGGNGANSADTLDKYAKRTGIDSANAPVILFETSAHDFGKIKQGDKVIYNFKFKNTGKSPLIIVEATSSCGCTVPEPPKEPIKPGQSSVIRVVFDSAGKSGKIEKVVTVNSNAISQYTDVYLTGEVEVPASK